MQSPAPARGVVGCAHMPGCSLQPMHTPHTPPWHAHVCVPTHLGTLHAHTCTHTLVCTPCKHTCAHGCILQARCMVSATRGSPGALRLLRAPSGPPALSQGLGSMGGRPRRGSEPWETLAAGLGEATECCRNGAKQTSSSRRTAKLARTQRGTPSPKPLAPHSVPVPTTGGLTHLSAHHVARSTTPVGVHALLAAPPNSRPGCPTAMGTQLFAPRGTPTPQRHTQG